MTRTNLHQGLLALALVLTTPLQASAAAVAYDAASLTMPGFSGARAYGINNDGVIAGAAVFGDANINETHAVVWHQGQGVDLGLGEARAINLAGHVAGSSQDAIGTQYATLWISQQPMLLSPGIAYGINDKDEVVGEAQGSDGRAHPAVWRQGVLKLLSAQAGRATAINSSGEIVGYITTTVNGRDVYTAVRWVQDVPTILSTDAKANGINDAGVVVGQPTVDYVSGPYYWTADNQAHAAPVSPGANDVTDVAGLTAINNQGTVIGFSAREGLVGQITDHFSRLTSYVKYPDRTQYATDWFQAGPTAINNAGTVLVTNCGVYVNCPSFELQPVGPVTCTVSGTLGAISSTAFSSTVLLTNVTDQDLTDWQYVMTLKDPTIVYWTYQTKAKVSEGGTHIAVTPGSTSPTVAAGTRAAYGLRAAKFPATVPAITSLSASLGGQACLPAN